MSLGRAPRDDDPVHPGEPGVGVDLPPPFAAPDEPTRWLFGLNRFGIRPGLGRIRGLLEDLGDPQQGMRVLVIAGTNGKGSTTRILARLLQAGGLRVATYTSPHLLNVHERILIDDREVGRAEFAERVAAIRPLVERREASWFETLTALAMRLARDRDVDVFVCEAGLGGRLDASNALPAAAVLLTTVGLDHQRILGATLREIAAEKLGLLKRGVPLFCGVDVGLRPQVFEAAVTAGSPCWFLDELAHWERGQPGTGAGEWDLTLRDRVFAGLPDPGTPALRRNVALSLLTLTELDRAHGGGWLPADAAAALGNLFLPGRYQVVLRRPDWILDTAHNPQALGLTLREFTAGSDGGRRVLLFGGMADKELDGDLAPLVQRCDAVLGAPVSLPRSRTPGELRDLLTGWQLRPEPWPLAGPGDPLPRCAVAPDLGAALSLLARTLGPQDRVLVTGSCFMVAEVLWRLGFGDLEATRTARSAAEVLGPLARRDGGAGPEPAKERT